MKTVKGTRDWSQQDCAQRNWIISIIKEHYEKTGAKELDTPVMELTNILQNQYGDDQKLIFDLKQYGDHEHSSLRYDLTVPLARYMIGNGLQRIRRFQIGKVYRRDQPCASRGRFREFTQADLDIVGYGVDGDSMIPEAQILLVGVSIMKQIGVPFKILYNFRHNLVYLLEKCGVKDVNTVCSSLDKLDKMSVDEVIKELVETKGISETVVTSLMESLRQMSPRCIEEREKLQRICGSLMINDVMEWSPSLARGMDYYSGLIFEFKILGTHEVGTVIAGGRYDNLSPRLKADSVLDGVGISVGVDRLYQYLVTSGYNFPISKDPLRVSLIPLGIEPSQVMHVYRRLIESGLKVNMYYRSRSIRHAMSEASESGSMHAIIVGKEELEQDTVTLKNLSTRTQTTVAVDDLRFL